MKKLLFFINALFGGGAEKVLCDLVNSLDKNKYEITVQTIYNEKNSNILLKNHINYKYIFERKSLKSRVVLKLANISNDLSWFYRKYVYSNYDIEVAF